MSDLASDLGVANQLAVGFQAVDVSSACVLPWPGSSNVSALVEGVSVSHDLKGDFDALKTTVDAKAANLVQIAQAFVDVDQSLAKGPS